MITKTLKKMNYKKFAFAVLLFAFFGNFIPDAKAQETLEKRLKNHVYTLADDSFAGRKAGSDFAKKAAAYIIAQWEEIGLTPLGGDSYIRPFEFGQYHNLAAIIEGNDPLLKDEYIIIGAHYDHLGGKINEKGDTVIYNGADDNASGVATVIELSRRLKEMQPTLRRSIILMAFDAEELGLFGSNDFAENPPFPLEKIKLMVSVDMVGWYKTSGYVKYCGTGTIINGKQVIADNAPAGLHVEMQDFERSMFTATDTRGFAAKGVPTFSVTTGLKSPYHKPGDVANLIDYEGMALITEHLTNVVRTIAQDDSFHASGKIASIHKSSAKKMIFGISANIGTNQHYYTAGALDGKESTSFGVGLSGQVNMAKFSAIRPEVYYDYIAARHPQGKITTHNITVPFNFVIQTPPSELSGAAVFIGPYYSHRFKGEQGKEELDFDKLFFRDEIGINGGFEVRVTNFRLALTYRDALTNFTRKKNADGANILNEAMYVTVSYIF